MMRVERGVVTAVVITAAQTVGKPIGDGEAPRGNVAGWIGGAPNQEGTNFVPYSVINPMSAGGGSGPLADPQGDVIFPYAVTSYGVSRRQCEWMADAVRMALYGLTQSNITMFAGQEYQYVRRVQQVMDQQIGTVQRVTETEPPYFGQSDVVALWTSR